jgi:hypothetical protein
MIEILYFIRWGPMRMQRDDPFARPLPLEQARALYDRRETHTALVLREGAPYAIVESHKDFVGVTFYDDQVREYLSYGFRELAPGRIFLEQANYWEYDGDRRDASTYTTYMFKPDFDKELKSTGIPRQVDVSGNWEPYPEFGEYAGLLQTDRPGG